jgi:hypothetical protein
MSLPEIQVFASGRPLARLGVSRCFACFGQLIMDVPKLPVEFCSVADNVLQTRTFTWETLLRSAVFFGGTVSLLDGRTRRKRPCQVLLPYR